jgi:hypothetical protein
MSPNTVFKPLYASRFIGPPWAYAYGVGPWVWRYFSMRRCILMRRLQSKGQDGIVSGAEAYRSQSCFMRRALMLS